MWLKYAIKQKDLVDFYSGTMYDDPEYSFAPGDPEQHPWEWKNKDDFYAFNMGTMLELRKDFVRQSAMLIVKELAYIIGEYEEIKYDMEGFEVEDQEAQDELELFRSAAEKSQAAIYSIHRNMMSPRGYELAAEVFGIEGIWDEAFGGQPWASICSGIISIINAKRPGDLQAAIDHMVDISHNTEYLIDAFQEGERFWNKPFLDEKSNREEGIWRGLPEGRVTRHKAPEDQRPIYFQEGSPRAISENIFWYLDEIISNIFRYCVSVHMSGGLPEDRFKMAFILRINNAFRNILPVVANYIRSNLELFGIPSFSESNLEKENRIRLMILKICERFEPQPSSYDKNIIEPYNIKSKMSFQGNARQAESIMKKFEEMVRPALLHSLDKFFSELVSSFS